MAASNESKDHGMAVSESDTTKNPNTRLPKAGNEPKFIALELEEVQDLGQDEVTGHRRHSSSDTNQSPPTELERFLANQKERSRRRWTQRLRRQLGKGGGGLFSTLGFVTSAAKALWADRSTKSWQASVNALEQFLQTTGLDLELSPSLNVRLLDHIIILSKIQSILLQQQHGNTATRRHVAAVSSPCQQKQLVSHLPSEEELLRYMKYATAAYGDNMIRAAEVEVMQTDLLDATIRRSFVISRKRISDHIGVPIDDLVLMDVDHGGDSGHLRHFVAVDHEHHKVVLAIRGTYTLSEVVVDIAAFSRSFCGGEAHSEMANMAERVWDAAGDTVVDLLRQNKDYEFILTGHSLGAGTACLLNILCHQNNRAMVGGSTIRCFAYASPPVYKPLEFAPDAVAACTHIIHGNDPVPFLSVHSIRRLFACIRAVEKHHLTWSQRWRLIAGVSAPSNDLIQAVHKAQYQNLTPKPGAPILVVPAAATLWLCEDQDSHYQQDQHHHGRYDAKLCTPMKLAQLEVVIDANLLQDHLPSRYEHALHNLDLEGFAP